MYKYIALEKGFYEGSLRDPNGKRQFVHSEKELKPIPKWLKLIGEESDEEREQREALNLNKSQESIAEQNKQAEEKGSVLNIFGGFLKTKAEVETL